MMRVDPGADLVVADMGAGNGFVLQVFIWNDDEMIGVLSKHYLFSGKIWIKVERYPCNNLK